MRPPITGGAVGENIIMELAGQNVLVLGLGLSGSSAARFCAERGANVTAADERPRDAIQNLDSLPSSIRAHVPPCLPAGLVANASRPVFRSNA